jgi:glycosyltransferase involved in cell wall biosynthesis
MKTLLIHNYYRHRGGEDIAFDNQKEVLSRAGIDVKVYSKSSKSITGISGRSASLLSLFYSLKTKRDLKKIIIDFGPDIAHIHNIYPLISRSVYDVLHKNNIPIVQTIHNYRFFCANGLCLDRGRICEKCKDLRVKNIFTDCRRESRLYNTLLALNLYYMRKKNIYSKVTRFIALSRFVKGRMIDAGIRGDRIKIIRNIMALPKTEGMAGNTGGGPYFLYLGRLSKEKGIMELLNVFSGLKDIRLRILGDGPLKEKIEEKVKAAGLENIELYGHIDGVEKYRIIGNALAVIIPSVCYEVSPLVIMESFKIGVPAIVNNIGSLPENVVHGKNGFIYSSLEGLKRSVLDMLDLDVEKLSKISEYCRKSYDEHFSSDRNLEELIRLYRKVLEEKK